MTPERETQIARGGIRVLRDCLARGEGPPPVRGSRAESPWFSDCRPRALDSGTTGAGDSRILAVSRCLHGVAGIAMCKVAVVFYLIASAIAAVGTVVLIALLVYHAMAQ